MGLSRNVELHIEELVLHGFDPRDRHAIADAVQQELTRLVAEQGLSAVQEPAEVPRLDGGTIELNATRGSGSGVPIARAVHSTLSGGER